VIRRYITIVAPTVISIIIACLAGCKGPSGPDGENAFLTDSLAPTIEWISPEPDGMVDSSVTLSAKVFDDQGVKRMSFFIANIEFAGSLVDTVEGIYTYEWLSLHWPEGPYPLMARALDDARNVAITPIIFVHVEHP